MRISLYLISASVGLNGISGAYHRCSHIRVVIDYADSIAIFDRSVVPMHKDSFSSLCGISSVPLHGMYVTAYAHALSHD
jgi:hypothetical protein